MTLTAENLHSTVNKKQSTQTLVQYAQPFFAAQIKAQCRERQVQTSTTTPFDSVFVILDFSYNFL